MKILYFEGAGWSGAEISKKTIGNCRIRTAFYLDNGNPVYLEIIASEKSKNKKYTNSGYIDIYTGFIDSLHYITDDIPNNDENLHSITDRNMTMIAYNHEGILKYVNSLGASFNKIEVLPDLAGYRVFKENYLKGISSYNYGDKFIFNAERTKRAEEIYNHFYKIEQNEGKKYPNFSLWVDEEDPQILHLLRHYNGYNKHWTIINADNWQKTIKEAILGKYAC